MVFTFEIILSCLSIIVFFLFWFLFFTFLPPHLFLISSSFLKKKKKKYSIGEGGGIFFFTQNQSNRQTSIVQRSSRESFHYSASHSLFKPILIKIRLKCMGSRASAKKKPPLKPNRYFNSSDINMDHKFRLLSKSIIANRNVFWLFFNFFPLCLISYQFPTVRNKGLEF